MPQLQYKNLSISFIYNHYKNGKGAPLDIDMTSIMQSPLGDTVSISDFGLSKLFFNSESITSQKINIPAFDYFNGYASNKLDRNGVYTIRELKDLGIPSEYFKSSISQYQSPNAADFDVRAFVFGSTSFALSESTIVSFVDKKLIISGAEIRPFHDNFDFNSGSIVGTLGNIWMRFLGADTNGDTFRLEYSGTGKKYSTYDATDFNNDLANPKLQRTDVNTTIKNLRAMETVLHKNGIIPTKCFLAGTPILVNKNTYKSIEELKIGDTVLAFASDKNALDLCYKECRVSKLFRGHTEIIVNLRGLKCTPGHNFLTIENGESNNFSFRKISHILKDDHLIISKDGKLIRARTGAEFLSLDDVVVRIQYFDYQNVSRTAFARAGIPITSKKSLCASDTGRRPAIRLRQWMEINGASVTPDGIFVGPDNTHYFTIDWPVGTTPFDDVISENWIVSTDNNQQYTPSWIQSLPL